jgi:hypothetical protein
VKKSRKPPVKGKRPDRKVARGYGKLLTGVVGLIEQARLAAVRSVNVVLTSTYWLVGQRIVEHEQSGSERAGYGELLLKRLAEDLTARLGRGFSETTIRQMRLFYLGWSIWSTLSRGPNSRYLSPIMFACSRSPMPEDGNTMNARRCWGAGRPVNSTDKSPLWHTREPAAQDRVRSKRMFCQPTRR